MVTLINTGIHPNFRTGCSNTTNQSDRTHSYRPLKGLRPSGFCQLSLLAQGLRPGSPRPRGTVRREAMMLAPPRTLTVGQLQERFKCLKQQPSHRTLPEVSKRSFNTRAPKKEQVRDSAGGDPAKPDNEKLPWQAHSQSDMLKEHVANKGKSGPYECGVPNKAVRMPCEKCNVRSRPSARRTQGKHHSYRGQAVLPPQRCGLRRGRCPNTQSLGKGSRPRAGPAEALTSAAPTEKQRGFRSQRPLTCRGGLNRM